MSLKKLITNYVDFNLWADTSIVSWLRTLPAGQLTEPVQSSYGSIDHTLQHMVRTDKFWLAFITGGNLTSFNWSVKNHPAEVTMAELLQLSTQLKEAAVNFTDTDLNDVLNLNMPWAKNQLSRYEYIVHVVNHATYHRGQIVTMARETGAVTGIPATDYNIFNCQSL